MGKKMAVLVGCNYPTWNDLDKLDGCHTDVLLMRELLVSHFSFSRNHIVLMTDKPGSPIMPTHANIMKALNKMIDQAHPHDILFFHFSGHGTLDGPHENVEAIVPSDGNLFICMCVCVLFSEMDFRHLVHRLPKNATFTILADSCNSGGLIDKEPEQVGPGHPVGQHGSSQAPPLTKKRKMIPIETLVQHLSALTGLESPDLGVHLLQHFGPDNCSILYRVPPHQHPKPLNKDQGILLSGCQSNESSYEGTNDFGEPCGQFDNALQKMFKGSQKSLTNRMIIIKATKMLKDERIMVQHPCLYCSKENADKDFLGVVFHK